MNVSGQFYLRKNPLNFENPVPNVAGKHKYLYGRKALRNPVWSDPTPLMPEKAPVPPVLWLLGLWLTNQPS